MGAVITKSIASDCTGPYDIENVWCDSMCVYTNHPYVTSFRGFGHSEYTLAIERTMDKLAYIIKAKGVACFWKTSSTPPDAASGAVVTFTPDGYANLSIGAVELGQGSKTVLAQILAENGCRED